MKIQLPETYQVYFWDVDWDHLKNHTEQYRTFIIARLADKGDIKQIKWLKSYFTAMEILQSVTKFSFVSAKTKNFWKQYVKNI